MIQMKKKINDCYENRLAIISAIIGVALNTQALQVGTCDVYILRAWSSGWSPMRREVEIVCALTLFVNHRLYIVANCLSSISSRAKPVQPVCCY